MSECPFHTAKPSEVVTLARRFRIKGVSVPRETDLLARRSYTKEEANQVWYVLGKVERYALEAVLIDRYIDRAIGLKVKMPPFGLIESRRVERDASGLAHTDKPLEDQVVREFDTFDPFGHLHRVMDDTLYGALESELSNLEMRSKRGFSQPIDGVYDRFIEWFNLLNSYIANKVIFPVDVLRKGHETSTREMGKVLRAVQELSPDSDPNDITATSRNSYRYLAELAGMHVYDFMGVRDTVNNETKYLHLKSTSNGSELKLKDDAYLFGQAQSHEYSKEQDLGPALGCVASINFGQGSVIRRLWDWYMELAPIVFKTAARSVLR